MPSFSKQVIPDKDTTEAQFIRIKTRLFGFIFERFKFLSVCMNKT